MAAPTAYGSSQVVATQLEQVSPKLPSWLQNEQSDFMKLFQKRMEKHQVSAWPGGQVSGVGAWRIPVTLSNGGDVQAISLDGGDAGSGSMMATAFMYLNYFASSTGFSIPMLAAMATKTRGQAVSNAMAKSISGAVRETNLYAEIGMFADPTGVLATGSGTGSPTFSGNSVTYDLETAHFISNRLRGYNALVDVYTTNLATKQGSARVTFIDRINNAVTLTVASGGTWIPVNTDVIAFPGMSPTLTTGSWRSGLYTYNTTNTSNSINGLSPSTYNELQCVSINAGSGGTNMPLTPAMIFAGKAGLVQRRDDKVLKGLVGVCHMAQRAAWYNLGLTIANNILRPGESPKAIDLAGQGTGYGNTFEAGDVVHYISRYADRSRVDWLVPQNFGLVELAPPGFITTPDGTRVFMNVNTTSGNPNLRYLFYLLDTRNYYSADPGCAVVYSGLAIPSGM